MKSTKEARAALALALSAAKYALDPSWVAFARRLSMSTRTLTRFTNEETFPGRTHALAILCQLIDLPERVYTQLADALAIEPAARPLRRGSPLVATAPVGPAEEASAALMLYRVSEANGVAPGPARNIALATLDYAASHGLDVSAARQVMGASAGAKASVTVNVKG